MSDLYVIEARHSDGTLNLSVEQPEQVFGQAAIHGITIDAMAKIIFRHRPHATLDGRYIGTWPHWINTNWVARRKTW